MKSALVLFAGYAIILPWVLFLMPIFSPLLPMGSAYLLYFLPSAVLFLWYFKRTSTRIVTILSLPIVFLILSFTLLYFQQDTLK